MKITNTLDYARDIAVDYGAIPVEPGETVDVPDELAARLAEQDGWDLERKPGKKPEPVDETKENN